MSGPAGSARLGTLSVLTRGWRTSPELRAGAGITVLLALVAAGGRVVVPILLQQMLDRGFEAGTSFWVMAVGGVGAVIVTAFAAAATRRRLAWAGESALCGLRTRAFRHIHRLSLATQTEERRGVLVSRVTSDIETLSHFLSWAGVAWLVNVAVMAVVVGVMAVYDWRLTLVALTVVVPMGFVLTMVQRKLSVAYDTVRQRVGEVLAAISEAVLGNHVIRSYGAQEQSTKRLDDAIEGSRSANVRAGVISAFLFPSGDVFSVLTVGAVLAFGVVLGPDGGMTLGKLVAFLFLTTLFLEPIAEFTEIIDQTQTAVAGWRKVLDVLDAPVEVIDPDPGVSLPPGPPQISIEVGRKSVPSELQPSFAQLEEATSTLPAAA